MSTPISLQPVAKKDIASIADAVQNHFGYVYETLFETDIEETKKLLKSLISCAFGKTILGYKSFKTIHSSKNVGFISTTHNNSFLDNTLTYICYPLIILSQLGIKRTFKILLHINKKLKAFTCATQKNELSINNLVIFPDFQRQGYAESTLRIITEQAKRLKKERIILDIRTNNEASQKFFTKNGFKNDVPLTDNLNNQDKFILKEKNIPSRIRMFKNI